MPRFSNHSAELYVTKALHLALFIHNANCISSAGFTATSRQQRVAVSLVCGYDQCGDANTNLSVSARMVEPCTS